MASDIINREMENLDLLSGGSSSAESTLSDVLRALDMRTVIANANKFGRRHLTNGDFDKWLDVGRKLTFLQVCGSHMVYTAAVMATHRKCLLFDQSLNYRPSIDNKRNWPP